MLVYFGFVFIHKDTFCWFCVVVVLVVVVPRLTNLSAFYILFLCFIVLRYSYWCVYCVCVWARQEQRRLCCGTLLLCYEILCSCRCYWNFNINFWFRLGWCACPSHSCSLRCTHTNVLSFSFCLLSSLCAPVVLSYMLVTAFITLLFYFSLSRSSIYLGFTQASMPAIRPYFGNIAKTEAIVLALLKVWPELDYINKWHGIFSEHVWWTGWAAIRL